MTFKWEIPIAWYSTIWELRVGRTMHVWPRIEVLWSTDLFPERLTQSSQAFPMNPFQQLTMMVFVALIYPCICKPFRLHSEQHTRRHRARRSLSQIGGHRSIFTELWGVDTEWSQSLGNPCFSRPNQLENAEEIDALGINGREREINLQSASLLSQLRALEPQMVSLKTYPGPSRSSVVSSFLRKMRFIRPHANSLTKKRFPF